MGEESHRYETVYAVDDYHDGPRTGFADFDGRPHHFDRVFDEDEDEFGEYFLLTPIDAQTLSLVMERWGIWRRWRSAFDAGAVALESHPSLPEEEPRYQYLSQEIDLAVNKHCYCRMMAKAEFRSHSGLRSGVSDDVEVRWFDQKS